MTSRTIDDLSTLELVDLVRRLPAPVGDKYALAEQINRAIDAFLRGDCEVEPPTIPGSAEEVDHVA